MKKILKTALLTDGSSDRVLLPIIDWMIGQHYASLDRTPCVWSDTRAWQKSAHTLTDRIVRTVQLQLCDILFVHRDAEAQPPGKRRSEIDAAIGKAKQTLQSPLMYVCVIPVRMQEAWLLIDEQAIRDAVGNPKGENPLKLPKLSKLEDEADPKDTLDDLLIAANQRSGHRKIPFNVAKAKHRLAELIDDFSPLRALPAFQQFEADFQITMQDYLASR